VAAGAPFDVLPTTSRYRPGLVDALAVVDTWGAGRAAAAVVDAGGAVVGAHGPTGEPLPIASVTKLLTAYATLIAVEEGTVALDEPAGRPGATVRHLLSHAAGYPFNGPEPVTAVGRRRIYSNTGFEVLARHVERAAAMAFASYLADAVLAPLAMRSSRLEGSPAYAVISTVDDLCRFLAELSAPTLLSPATLAEAVSVQFPGLDGMLPGIGRQRPMDWGLGFERRDAKRPHWTGSHNSPETYGHFGGSGTFLWVDPVAERACVVLTDREFGPWALEAWPALSDAVLAA
jgi:CubicO group peptidase (beta-lactamase class C family)